MNFRKSSHWIFHKSCNTKSLQVLGKFKTRGISVFLCRNSWYTDLSPWSWDHVSSFFHEKPFLCGCDLIRHSWQNCTHKILLEYKRITQTLVFSSRQCVKRWSSSLILQSSDHLGVADLEFLILFFNKLAPAISWSLHLFLDANSQHKHYHACLYVLFEQHAQVKNISIRFVSIKTLHPKKDEFNKFPLFDDDKLIDHIDSK